MKVIAGMIYVILMTMYQCIVPQKFWRERHLNWVGTVSFLLSILLIVYILFLVVKLIML